jgi:hypothetical protein
LRDFLSRPERALVKRRHFFIRYVFHVLLSTRTPLFLFGRNVGAQSRLINFDCKLWCLMKLEAPIIDYSARPLVERLVVLMLDEPNKMHRQPIPTRPTSRNGRAPAVKIRNKKGQKEQHPGFQRGPPP